eukprot:CAMPEP_0201927334 /NCGR_PEP_ID=MMETSP0903-20130614/18478_1 /ASSEMBLY_ACC=CAM_ASM_000552 /TAXON_ID=420261 /ORGANISM="Thalassiosira antarctica, Strain CCMP982" /LENGTH=37 /DNA_ID= /DNA_START= /DNA_END= /DNA_ORIENTATION=
MAAILHPDDGAKGTYDNIKISKIPGFRIPVDIAHNVG